MLICLGVAITSIGKPGAIIAGMPSGRHSVTFSPAIGWPLAEASAMAFCCAWYLARYSGLSGAGPTSTGRLGRGSPGLGSWSPGHWLSHTPEIQSWPDGTEAACTVRPGRPAKRVAAASAKAPDARMAVMVVLPDGRPAPALVLSGGWWRR